MINVYNIYKRSIKKTKENGTKYYALSIGEDIKREEKFMSLFDKVWYV